MTTFITMPNQFGPIAWDEAGPEYWHITKGAFFDRFGSQKSVVLSCSNEQVRAMVLDIMVREYVDLKRPDVDAGVHSLVDFGLITAELADSVLYTKTTEDERIHDLPPVE